MNTIAKAKGLLVEPGKTWDGIAAEPMTLGGVFTSYVLPLAAIPSIGSAIGTFLAGNMPNLQQILVNYVIALVAVLIMGKVMPLVAVRLGAVPDGIAGMKLAAFAPTGAWVGGLALIVPSIGQLLALVGAFYTLYLFYDGAQRLFPVPPERARVLGLSAVVASFLIGMLLALGGSALGIVTT
ncbi:MAG: DUF1282 family protein [Roseomonas sp.]|nr:DUF1282 family protein [Roseomonas sp.]MCA3382402.1 DUF1282 family protein [Roseomonas sp.]